MRGHAMLENREITAGSIGHINQWIGQGRSVAVALAGMPFTAGEVYPICSDTGRSPVTTGLLALMPRPFGSPEKIVTDFLLQRFDLTERLLEHGFIHVPDLVHRDAVVHLSALLKSGQLRLKTQPH
jgi:hypothetical protein